MPSGYPREIRLVDGEKVYQCSRCKEWKEKKRMSGDSRYVDEVASWCKRCKNESIKSNRDANPDKYKVVYALHYQKNREAIARRNKIGRMQNMDRGRAAQKLLYAVKSGRMERPDACEMCGAVGRVVGHHDSYDADRRLVVIWVCCSCHGWIHARRREQCA